MGAGKVAVLFTDSLDIFVALVNVLLIHQTCLSPSLMFLFCGKIHNLPGSKTTKTVNIYNGNKTLKSV